MRSTTRPVLKAVETIAADDIVGLARRSRRNAEAFRKTVDRFGQEMPHSMERFHEAMKAFRTVARSLSSGGYPITEPAAPVAAPALAQAA